MTSDLLCFMYYQKTGITLMIRIKLEGSKDPSNDSHVRCKMSLVKRHLKQSVGSPKTSQMLMTYTWTRVKWMQQFLLNKYAWTKPQRKN